MFLLLIKQISSVPASTNLACGVKILFNSCILILLLPKCKECLIDPSSLITSFFNFIPKTLQ